MNHREQAEELRLALLMDLVAARDVIDWADAMIQKEAVPPDWVFDISLAANEPKEAIIARLSDVTDRIDVVLPSQKALERLARAFDSGELAPLDAAQKLVLWASSTRISDDGRSEAFTVKFIAEDVEDGIYGSPADVTRAVNRFLVKHGVMRNAG